MASGPQLDRSAEHDRAPLLMYHLIHEIYVLSDACDRQLLSQYGLTISQYRLLSLLHNEKGQRLTKLSERLLLSKSTITRIVDQLEHLGWVSRIPDPEDRRAQRVVITSTGAEHRAILQAAHRRSLEQRLQSLPPSKSQQLIILLSQLSEGLRTVLSNDPQPDADS